MSTKDEQFLQQLRATFKVEAEEHVQAIAAGLRELEKAAAPEQQRGVIETVFRAAHSLKGAARVVEFTEVESQCQSLEDMFAAWKRQGSVPSLQAIELVRGWLDPLTDAIAAPPAGAAAAPPVALAADLAEAGSAAEYAPLQHSVRIPVAKLDARLVAAEEMLSVKLTAGQHAADLRELARTFDEWNKAWSAVAPQARALHRQAARPARAGAAPDASPDLGRLLEFFDWSVDYIRGIESRTAALAKTAEQDHHVIGNLVDDVLEESKKLLVLPFATIAPQFPKLVRDLCRDQGKEAELAIRGAHIEIDKRILEAMKDPIIHLLRNAVDHGIETPEQRARRGKPARGTIDLAVSQVNGSKVEISIADDGAGIDAERIKASAAKLGVIAADETRALSDAEACALIFQSEVSTSPIITRVSGRGLGLAIVKEKAEAMGGTVVAASRPGSGTSIRIVLPAVLATFHGVQVESAGRIFVVPTHQVDRVARVHPADIQTVEGRDTVVLGGGAVALARLADVLGLPQATPPEASPMAAPVIVLGIAEQRIAFMVDAVLDEQEVLVKPLGRLLSRVSNIAGATVLASGQVAPVLNVADLLKSAKQSAAAPMRSPPAAAPTATSAKAILVVEDSITSRMLLKGILETASYRVATAADGMDAFALLRREPFDLVVSDVEMPRLDGFALTARIRADKKLAEIPVILVTALETREDRERGIDVGADAYIVKSSFDQSDLLEAIRRLL